MPSYKDGKKVLLIVAIAAAAFIFFGLIAITLIFFDGQNSNPFEKKLAVIPIKESISMYGDEFGGSLGAIGLVEKIDEAENDPSIAAIFFDIDSPGGEAVATHQIVEKIKNTKKPTISYIGSMGASAAYWIAASTDYIIADQFSVTASIGAISIFPNIKGLLEEFGAKINVVRSGELKALPNLFEDFNQNQKELIQEFVNEAFLQFKSDIIEFRGDKINPAEFEKITDGRIISGKKALELRLVDELLTREKAIEKAGQIAGIAGKPELKEFGPKKSGLFNILSAAGKAFAGGLKMPLDLQNSISIRT